MDLLIIFVKHPIAGQVKTRLAASIGDEKAVLVYQALLDYTHSIVAPLPVDKAVFYGNHLPDKDLWSEAGYTRRIQSGAGLGDRMESAFAWGFEQGYRRIVIIGSDCAELTTRILMTAFEQLQSDDVVIGPATDGGYYLLGSKQLHRELFQNKNWSTASVYTETIGDINKEALRFTALPFLSDIDTIADLTGTFLEKYV